ncbi:hypothetical protein BDBG_08506 [Blastomyces gilchristii SLH14081]|uniref:Uncharacterized protein n=1 Tax=Blastomyces gilchristii (strain SLH14081) TaxID=559298 RepID=A0A179V1H2_BLAGS|nr:uncharacterized protein BDBG_08506 [Blastomyces gilchristii SLH14081]OAT13268.1 hypothetical protein BDBG_08506 [Blastomyces gilchristii SLH14081]
MFILEKFSAAATRMKLMSFTRMISFKGHGHASVSPTVGKAKARTTRLSPRSWRAGRPSSCKVDSELILEVSPCASLRPLHPPASPAVLENANGSCSRFSTQVNDTCSNFAEEGSITGALAPPVEAPPSPIVVPSSNTPILQDGDIEEERMTPFDEPDFRLQYEQQRHAIHIAALEDEYKEKMRAVVDEKNKLKKELEDAKKIRDAFEQQKTFWNERFVTVSRDRDDKVNELKKKLEDTRGERNIFEEHNIFWSERFGTVTRAQDDKIKEIKKELEDAREERDSFENQKSFWNERFLTVTRRRDDKIDELKRERDRFQASYTAVEPRAKALEALANHQQVQLEEMEKVIEESKLQLGKQREELEYRCQENNLLLKQIEEYEASNLTYFQNFHNLAQCTEQFQSRCAQLEQEVEKLNATKSELEASLTAAHDKIQISTLKQLAREQELSEDIYLAKTRQNIAEYHLSYLQETWRAEHTKSANELADCRAELLLKDKHIDVVRQQKDCCQHVITEVVSMLAGRAEDGNEFARQLSLYVSETLDRNEELGLQIFNPHGKELSDSENEGSG